MGDRLTVSSELLDRKEQGVAEQTARTFLHSLVQSPINGIVQIADKSLGTDYLPSVQVIQPAREANNAGEWHLQQFAQAAGMLPWFVGLHKVGSAGLGRLAGLEAKAATGVVESAAAKATLAEGAAVGKSAEAFLSRKTAVEVGAATLSGLTYGGLLTPVKPEENFVAARFRNAGSSAITFATMSTTMRGLESAGLKSQTLGGIISGVPAGFMAAESHSLLSGKGFASQREIATSVYGFMLVGGGFGFAQGRMQGGGKGTEIESPGKSKGTGSDSAVVAKTEGKFEIIRPTETPPPVELATSSRPVELATGQKFEMQLDGKTQTVEIAALTDRMAVLRCNDPAAEAPRTTSMPVSDFANRYVPVEVTVNGQTQVRFVMSAKSQIVSGVWKAERVGDRMNMVQDNNFMSLNRPETVQWADTARLKAGGAGTPQVDWSLAPDLRAEMNGGPPPRGPRDLLAGHEIVRTERNELKRDQIALRIRGETHSTSSARSGTIVLEKPGQPWVAELKDGRRITMESPGPWEVATPSNKVISKDGDGHVTIRNWDGDLLHVIRNPEAPQYQIRLGGPGEYPLMTELPKPAEPPAVSVVQKVESLKLQKTWLSDGTRVEFDRTRGGEWQATRPDGSTFNKESAGPWEIIDSMGCRLRNDASGVLVKHESKLVRTWHPDGTTVTENLSAPTTGIKFTEINKPGSPDQRVYDDPAVPGQKVTQIAQIKGGRIGGSEFDWEAVGPDGRKFNYESSGPWEVSLLYGGKLKKDAAGNLLRSESGRTTEYQANGDKVFSDTTGVTILKPDNTQFVLYRGATRYLKISPDGKTRTEVDSPDAPVKSVPDRGTVIPLSDPFSLKDF